MLVQHLTTSIPDLRSLGYEVPRALNELVQRLLRKDPRDRYQSADAALSDLKDIAESVESGRMDPAIAIGSSDRRVTITESAFIGREVELGILDREVQNAAAGRGTVVLLESESGGGKSRFVNELALLGARHDAWVLRGEGLNQVGQKPFLLLDGVVEQFIAAATFRHPTCRRDVGTSRRSPAPPSVLCYRRCLGRWVGKLVNR